MLNHSKKLLCYTIITTILNTSIQPLYAVHNVRNNIQEDISDEKPRSRLLRLEDFLQDKIKTSANRVQEATPDFIKNPVSHIYEGMCSWVEDIVMDIAPSLLTKTPFEIDYGHDLTFWKTHYTGEINELKNSEPNKFALHQERLKELQDIVWSGLLSPYQYEQGLTELKQHGHTSSFIQEVQNQFLEDLKVSPALLRDNFQRDLLISLEGIRSRDTDVEDMHTSEKEINNFKDLLSYYRQVQNPLDYTHNLVEFNRFIQQNKQALNITNEQYSSLKKAIVKAINQRNPKEYRALKAAQRQFTRLNQEFPYYDIEDADVLEDNFNSALPSIVKKANIQESSSFFINPLKGLTHLANKGMKYAIEHPFQAITIGLASQVAATAALNTFRVNPSKTPENRAQSLEQETQNQVQQKQGSQEQTYADEKIALQEKVIQEQSSSHLFSKQVKRDIGDEFQINQNTSSNGDLSIASLTNGKTFVAWDRDDGGYWNIYGRLFSDNGTALSNEININQNLTSNQFLSSIASLNNNNIFLSWYGYKTGDADIYGRVFFPNGTSAGNEFKVNQIATYAQYSPFVTSLSNGNAFIAWYGEQNGGDIYGRIFSPNGTAFTDEFPINQNKNGYQSFLSVTGLSNDNAFITWQGNQGVEYDLYGRVFFPNGTALTNEFPINQNKTAWQVLPFAKSLGDNNIFVAWNGNQTGNWNIYGRMFYPNGTALNNDFRINQNTSLSQSAHSSIANLDNGNIFVAWNGNQKGNWDIYGRFFSIDGAPISNEFGVNQITTASQYYPCISRLANSNIFAAWTSDQSGNWDVYGRVFTNQTITDLILNGSTTGSNPTTTSTTSMSLTSGIATTGLITTSSPSSSSYTTMRLSSSTNAVDPVLTTLAPLHSTSPSSSDKSSDIPIIIGGVIGGGGALCLGGGAAYYLYKCSKNDSHRSLNGSLELEENTSINPSPFNATSGGYAHHPHQTVVGAIRNHTYSILKDIYFEEAKLIQPHTAKKIPSFSSPASSVAFILGKGQFGQTYVGNDVETNELYAIKEVSGRKAVDDSQREGELQNELKDCPHIMPLVDYRAFEPTRKNDQPRLFQIMPLAYTNGVGYKQMVALLKDRDPENHERLASDNFHQLMKGLAYMHELGIYHLDIKDENILYMLDGTLRISDLGLARKLGKNDQVTEGRLGDRRKFSPEQYAFVRYNWKQEGKDVGLGELVESFSAGLVDSWGGGLYILELLLNDDPFKESIAAFQIKVKTWTNATFQSVLDTLNLLQEGSSTSFKGILCKVLAVDFKERLNPAKAVKGISLSQILSTEERTQVFKNLILIQESHQKEQRPTEVAPTDIALTEIVNTNLYYSARSREENENYRYNSQSTSENTQETSNRKDNGKEKNKYYDQ